MGTKLGLFGQLALRTRQAAEITGDRGMSVPLAQIVATHMAKLGVSKEGCARRTRREWLLDIEYRQRETFA
jgi:hypothetical protein